VTNELISSLVARFNALGPIPYTNQEFESWQATPDRYIVAIFNAGELIGAFLGLAEGPTFRVVETYMELEVWHDRPTALQVFRLSRDWIKAKGFLRFLVEACARQLEAIRACQENGVKILGYKPGYDHPLGVATVQMEVTL
jgi:hypothetical protein